MASNCSALDPGQAAACEYVATYVQPSLALLQGDINAFFLLWGMALVLFMHAGFAMLSAGAVRSKNARNILLCISLDLCMCCLAWYICGFAFAFGKDDGNGFIGTSYFVGFDVGYDIQAQANQVAGAGVTFAFWGFQFAFAATSATIVSGAVAERARFESYLIYSFYLSAIV